MKIIKLVGFLVFLLLFEFVNCQNKLDKTNDSLSTQIIVYGSDTCHYCMDTKNFLKVNNIKFVYFDVDVNIDKQKEMIAKLKAANIALSNLMLPVVDKGGSIFINNYKFEEFLSKLLEKL